jgi:hypothetical protein
MLLQKIKRSFPGGSWIFHLMALNTAFIPMKSSHFLNFLNQGARADRRRQQLAIRAKNKFQRGNLTVAAGFSLRKPPLAPENHTGKS